MTVQNAIYYLYELLDSQDLEINEVIAVKMGIDALERESEVVEE